MAGPGVRGIAPEQGREAVAKVELPGLEREVREERLGFSGGQHELLAGRGHHVQASEQGDPNLLHEPDPPAERNSSTGVALTALTIR